MGRVADDSVEFFNLISRKVLNLRELKGLFNHAEQITKEMGYDKWFMDTIPVNKKIAERFNPIKIEKVSLLGFDLLRFYYGVNRK